MISLHESIFQVFKGKMAISLSVNFGTEAQMRPLELSIISQCIH